MTDWWRARSMTRTSGMSIAVEVAGGGLVEVARADAVSRIADGERRPVELQGVVGFQAEEFERDRRHEGVCWAAISMAPSGANGRRPLS